MNRVLYRFSDISHSTRLQQKELWRQGNKPKLPEITQAYAPVHLRKQFEEFYRKLHPCLVQREGKNNASAFLQGSRGSGKSLLLNQCLQAFQDELMASNKQVFHKVQLNGIVTPGDQVSLVVREILRQLSTEAYQQTKSTTIHSSDSNKRVKTNNDRFEELLRLKRTSFTNNIQLLNEILKLACIDGVPILFVLEELDAFIGSTPSSSVQEETSIENVGKDRQVLLYHLLDRVATQGSFVSFVGLPCHYGTIGMLEKRIRSRAEGTSCFLQFGPCASLETLKDIVLSKLDDDDDDDDDDTAKTLRRQLSELLSKPTDDTEPVHRRVYEVLNRDQRLGKDIRWFSRVFTIALSLFRQDCVSQLRLTTNNANVALPLFDAKYLKEALVDMGGSFLTDSGERDLAIVDDMAVDPRIQALIDLSGPQVALVLASRRILARDSHRENYTVSLTLGRILEEYRSYQGNSNRYNNHVLYKSFRDLLELNVFRAASDHSGAAPLQFNHDISVYSMDPNILGRMPLHLTVDIHRELRKAIEKNLLNCSTALREWGRKIN